MILVWPSMRFIDEKLWRIPFRQMSQKMMKKSKNFEKFENFPKSSATIIIDDKSLILMKIDKKSHFNVVYVENI